MRACFFLLASIFFNFPVWAESPNAAFAAPDVATALNQVFGRSAYAVTDQIKIQSGSPGNARPIIANGFGDRGRVMLSIDFTGPLKVAVLMEPARPRREMPTPLLAVYRLAEIANEIVVPVHFPYTDVRMTVVVEAQGKLWGVREEFFIRRSSDSMEGGGRGPCEDKPRDKLPRFTGPALDNLAYVYYTTQKGVSFMSVGVQHQMNWAPVLDSRNCTLATPSAIQSARLEYDGTVQVEAEWGEGIEQPTIMLSLPTARVGDPLTLDWRDTRGVHYVYSTTLAEGVQVGLLPLHSASKKGDVDTVRRLLVEGASVNATLANGWTALGLAAANNQLEVVKVLLDHGADPNIRFQYGDTALMWAAYTRHLGVVETLLARGADGSMRDRYDNNLFSLTVHGAKGALLTPKSQPDIFPVVQLLLDRGLVDRSAATLSALQVAVEQNEYSVIKALVESGFNPPVYVGETPLLIWAVKQGYAELVADMLRKGAPVNVESQKCETPLLAALSRGEYRLERERKKMVGLLLEYGANPMYQNKRGVDAFKAVEAVEIYQKEAIIKLLTGATQATRAGASHSPP